ncbi:MAG TPA: hypothetical protein VHD85_15695 [Terracidiphilus sp.]|nr:hypothetical protein [Terracidiphilus sp.]
MASQFSTNPDGDIWPYIRNGYISDIDRKNVRGYSPLLDQIADIYLTVREEGGRFFIDDKGAFWKKMGNKLVQFAHWNFDG